MPRPDDRRFPLMAQLAAVGSVTSWELNNELSIILWAADNAARALADLPIDHPARLQLRVVKDKARQAASKLQAVAAFYAGKGVRPTAATIEGTLDLLNPPKKAGKK